jgi:hypothetical protein
VNPTPRPGPGADVFVEMCDHLDEMSCEEGKDVYNDDLPGPVDVPNQSCEDFYKSLQDEGIDINPKCIIQAPSCDVIEDYRAKDPAACN